MCIRDRDYNNQFQLENWLLAGIADFDQNSDSYRNYMEYVHRSWLKLGFDGFRIDTIKHVPNAFWKNFAKFLFNEKEDITVVGEYYGTLPNENIDVYKRQISVLACIPIFFIIEPRSPITIPF